MTSFADLPIEIVRLIMSFGSGNDFVSWMCTCKTIGYSFSQAELEIISNNYRNQVYIARLIKIYSCRVGRVLPSTLHVNAENEHVEIGSIGDMIDGTCRKFYLQHGDWILTEYYDNKFYMYSCILYGYHKDYASDTNPMVLSHVTKTATNAFGITKSDHIKKHDGRTNVSDPSTWSQEICYILDIINYQVWIVADRSPQNSGRITAFWITPDPIDIKNELRLSS